MRILLLISILSILGAGEPEVLEAFVVKYFMLSKSKMEYIPTAWQLWFYRRWDMMFMP